MHDPLAVIPFLLFLLLCAGVAFRLRRRVQPSSFIGEYYLGGRSMNGFVLAMTTVATFVTVSLFLGSPGQAWDYGFSWVYMTTSAVVAPLLIFGLVGKKLALIGRKLNAVTLVDIIRSRYHSDTVATFSALLIVLFFGAVMVAQLVGGATLFEAVSGYSYETGLLILGGTVVIFTAVGGFRGVVVTDALCAVAMIFGVVVIAGGILSAGDGYEATMEWIALSEPALLTTDAGGTLPWGLYLTQWLLIGICAFALPQSAIRVVGAKSSTALRRALVISTVAIGFLVIGSTSLGVLAHGVIPDELVEFASTDVVIPLSIISSLPTWLIGLCIIGPLAAAISTMSSLLIGSSSAIMKDIYLRRCENRGIPVPQGRTIMLSQVLTLALGFAAVLVALMPTSVVWWVDVFAFGGLEAAFVWMLVCGLFWKRANKYGAFASMAGGTIAYCLCSIAGIEFMSAEHILVALGVSLACMIGASLVFKQSDIPDLEKVFFPVD